MRVLRLRNERGETLNVSPPTLDAHVFLAHVMPKYGVTVELVDASNHEPKSPGYFGRSTRLMLGRIDRENGEMLRDAYLEVLRRELLRKVPTNGTKH